MLRNVVYKDKDREIIVTAGQGMALAALEVFVYDGCSRGLRTQIATMHCEFTHALTGSLYEPLVGACWSVVNEYGSVSAEVLTSVSKAILKEFEMKSFHVREIDWTKQVPTELGSGGTN